MKPLVQAVVSLLVLLFVAPEMLRAHVGGAHVDDIRAERIDAVFARFDSPESPGCAVGVCINGELVFAKGYGMANLEHDIPITPTSVFHVASVSKQFAAMAIVLLAQEGKLSLDDDIRKHLPELYDFGHEITIRHLIHHTSGLRDQWNLLSLGGWRAGDIKTQRDVLNLAFAQRQLNFEPGAEHMYSNTGYTLLAEIVYRITGKTLREYTTEAIFEPLGMTQTHFQDDFNRIVKHRTHAYSSRGRDWRVNNPAYSLSGATSLLSEGSSIYRCGNLALGPRKQVSTFGIGGPIVGVALLYSGFISID